MEQTVDFSVQQLSRGSLTPAYAKNKAMGTETLLHLIKERHLTQWPLLPVPVLTKDSMGHPHRLKHLFSSFFRFYRSCFGKILFIQILL